MSDTSWYQQALTPPQVVEVNVRFGVIPGQDHAQALVEMKDPTTGVLLGQWSRPHVAVRGLPELVEWASRTALRALEDQSEPF